MWFCLFSDFISFLCMNVLSVWFMVFSFRLSMVFMFLCENRVVRVVLWLECIFRIRLVMCWCVLLKLSLVS